MCERANQSIWPGYNIVSGYAGTKTDNTSQGQAAGSRNLSQAEPMQAVAEHADIAERQRQRNKGMILLLLHAALAEPLSCLPCFCWRLAWSVAA